MLFEMCTTVLGATPKQLLFQILYISVLFLVRVDKLH